MDNKKKDDRSTWVDTTMDRLAALRMLQSGTEESRLLVNEILRQPTPEHDHAQANNPAPKVPHSSAMADSDEEYVQGISDDEVEAHQVTRGAGASSGQGSRGGAWEVTRTWENVVEGADGTINSTVEGLLEADKRKRILKDTTPLQRGIIRHLLLILDLSTAMMEKDLRPTRYLLTIRYTTEFITEFFEQNPISQLGIIGMRDGLAVRISDISGNPNDHIGRLEKLRAEEPKGQPSLQNALDMARGALFHAPAHATREVLLIFGSLLSSDPGDIHETIRALATSHVTCSVIGLAAQVAICKTLVDRTNQSLPTAQTYNVALNEQHYRDLLMRATTPPKIQQTASKETAVKPSLLKMGFPSRMNEPEATFCACHSKPIRGGYTCPQCSSKVCALPTDCPVCGLTLILSTHLARSYHHLFPLKNWKEVSWAKAASNDQKLCFGCQTPFAEPPASVKRALQRQGTGDQNSESLANKEGNSRASAQHTANDGKGKGTTAAVGSKDGVSESGRYECDTCGTFFCIDCDVFAHEIGHNCPGCQCREGELLRNAGEENTNPGTQDGGQTESSAQ